MDGVLVDFVGGACKALGKKNPYTYKKTVGTWDLTTLFNMSAKDFWTKIDSQEFWANLEWTNDGRGILKAVERVFGDRVVLLTKPSLNPCSYAGKYEWIMKNMPEYANRHLMGTIKHCCAHRKSVLIDDCDANISAWSDAGGEWILVPRIWNMDYGISDKSYNVVRAALSRYKQRRTQ